MALTCSPIYKGSNMTRYITNTKRQTHEQTFSKLTLKFKFTYETMHIVQISNLNLKIESKSRDQNLGKIILNFNGMPN